MGEKTTIEIDNIRDLKQHALDTNKTLKQLINEAISEKIAIHEPTKEELLDQMMLQVRGMLNEGRIHIGEKFNIEISHHYGLRRFREFGAVIIDCVNREYCKKLIIQLPRQKHPYHYQYKRLSV